MHVTFDTETRPLDHASTRNDGTTSASKNLDGDIIVTQHKVFSTPPGLIIEEKKTNLIFPLPIIPGVIILIGIIIFIGIRCRKNNRRIRRRRNSIIREEAMMEMTSVVNDRYRIQEVGSERCQYIEFF